jgi:hypothetical protein
MASNNLVALCHPLPYGRRTAPSKKDGGALEGKMNDYAAPAQGQHRDVRPAGPVTSVTIGPVRPSPPSQHHPGHCIPISYTVGRRGDKMPPRRLLCALRPPISRTLEPMYRQRPNERPRHPPPSKTLLDRYRARHDAPLDARFARTTVYSTALYIIPPHVDNTVQHTCKLPPP